MVFTISLWGERHLLNPHQGKQKQGFRKEMWDVFPSMTRKSTIFFVNLQRNKDYNFMKDLKQTIVGIVPHYRNWTKRLWKPYLLTALTLGALSTVVFSILMPIAASDDAMLSFVVGETLVQVSPVLIVAVLAGLASLALSVAFAIKAHKAMRKVLLDFPKTNLTRQRRNVLLVELVFMVLLVLMALSLPVLTLWLSALSANRCSILLDEIHSPWWPWASVFIVSTIAATILLVTFTFIRACFYELNPVKTAVQEEPNQAVNGIEHGGQTFGNP